MKFRNDKLNDFEKKYIIDEWSAVKYGAEENNFERFCTSLVWPIQVCSHFVPLFVLMLNEETKETKKTKETKETKETK
jgi:hypothetical protein